MSLEVGGVDHQLIGLPALGRQGSPVRITRMIPLITRRSSTFLWFLGCLRMAESGYSEG